LFYICGRKKPKKKNMFKTTEYFDGKVKSIAFQTNEGPATIGVMEKGEYVFGTATIEYMTVTSGTMDVMLPEENTWKTYHEFETFIVQKDVKFKVKIDSDTSYRCLYK
jgi:hypothetical protein